MLTLEKRFLLCAIVGGLVCAGILLLVRPLVCHPASDKWTAQSYQHPAPENNRSYSIVIEKNKSAEDGENTPKNKYSENAYEILCGELKATDLALVFFTYILALVGLYQMRSADENTKRKERAYVVSGPLYGIPNEYPPISDWIRKNRALASMFRGPYRMGIMNFGQTAGFTTKVEWGLCPKKDFHLGVKVSDLLSLDCFSDWRVEWMTDKNGKRREIVIQDILEPSGADPKQYRHVEVPSREIDSVFFGKITYKDVFGDEHWTTFSYHMVKDHSDSIGKSLSDDHS